MSVSATPKQPLGMCSLKHAIPHTFITYRCRNVQTGNKNMCILAPVPPYCVHQLQSAQYSWYCYFYLNLTLKNVFVQPKVVRLIQSYYIIFYLTINLYTFRLRADLKRHCSLHIIHSLTQKKERSEHHIALPVVVPLWKSFQSASSWLYPLMWPGLSPPLPWQPVWGVQRQQLNSLASQSWLQLCLRPFTYCSSERMGRVRYRCFPAVTHKYEPITVLALPKQTAYLNRQHTFLQYAVTKTLQH